MPRPFPFPFPFPPSSSPCCAACRHMNAKCEPDCPYAPYFPANQMDGFLAVNEVYGMEILKELLESLKPAERRKLAEELVGDAQLLIRPMHRMLSHVDSLLFQRLLLEEMIRRSSEENAKLRAQVLGDIYDASLLDEQTVNAELLKWPNEQQQQQQEIGPFDAGYNYQTVGYATIAESSEQGTRLALEQQQEEVGVSNIGGNDGAWGYSDDANSPAANRHLAEMPIYSPDAYDFAFPEQPPQYDGDAGDMAW